jgi:SAM-dependent methyltransferase
MMMPEFVRRIVKKLKKARNSRRKTANKIAKKNKPSLLYQSKRIVATEQRWEIIAARLDDRDQTLLDIACNLGEMTKKAADKGLVALGIDYSSRAITAAHAKHNGASHLAFMRFEVTPESAPKIPSFDVTLCLSVYHYWMQIYGHTIAWSMVGALINRTRRKFFFEPASLLKKYGANPPMGVTDLDREGLIEYHLKQLNRVAGDGCSVLQIGETACLGPEPFRLLFMVSKERPMTEL